MGRTHLQALARAQRVELRAICEPSEGVAASLDVHVPVDRELELTLARDDVAAVLIAAPTPLHGPIVERALAAGRHVLCEKPLTLDPAADVLLAREAQRRGLVLHVGFWRRHAWPYREARRLLVEGAIGELRLIRLCQWDAEPPPAAFCDVRVSGGLEVDCGVHECDLAAWLAGSPVVEVAARGSATRAELAAVGDVEAVAAVLATAGGQAVTIDLSRTCAYGDVVRSELVGSHGALVIEAHGAGALSLGDGRGLSALPGLADDVLLDALAHQADAFARAITGASDGVSAGPREATAALVVAQAMRASRLSGRVEQLPAAIS